jgi:ATP-dependent Zn protease
MGALVAASLPGVDPVHRVSIVPRGVGALGYTMQRPTEDRFVLARRDLANRIAVLMGGRASEALIFDGETSTQATVILRTRIADLDEGGRLLLAHETLTADQFPAIRPTTRQPETVS